jgi:GNAT superfamily N-acetyltransferase
VTVQVHRVGPERWETWREVRLEALRVDPDAFGSTLEREEAFGPAVWRERLDGRSGPAVLAETDGGPVGMGAGYGYEPGRLMVVAMWTAPAWRGRGIGRRILDEVVAWGLTQDLSVDLWVEDRNVAARTFYERYGFVADGATAPLRDGSPLTMSRLVLTGRAHDMSHR